MKTSRFLNLMIVSLVAMAYTSCSNSDDVIVTPDPVVKTYTMTVDAQKGSNGTRALDLDGNTLNSTWTAGETVKVYKGDTELGTLTAQSDGASTSLKGTLTGDIAESDVLTLKYLSPDYDSQDGTIASISANCDYSTATVTVSGIAGGNISTTNANFVNQQAVIKFTLKNADGSLLLTPTSFRMTDGTSTVTLTIPSTTRDTNGSGVLYVAFPASDASATITLSATAGDAVYSFGKTGITFVKGKYYGVTVKMKEIPVLNGKFTINASGDQIRFSPGNLRYVSGAWSFFDTQDGYYDTYSADAWDKFGWVGQTGSLKDSTPAKWGVSTSKSDANYGTNASENMASDWGNVPGIGTDWRTLTQAEWVYLFNTRTASTVNYTDNARYAKAKVNNVHGVILFPDTYTHPADVKAPEGINVIGNTGWDGNDYDATAWGKMESAGCVFLPAAGYRSVSSVDNVGYYGYYWSSTASDANKAYRVNFSSYGLNADFSGSRYFGCSVRLVREVE